MDDIKGSGSGRYCTEPLYVFTKFVSCYPSTDSPAVTHHVFKRTVKNDADAFKPVGNLVIHSVVQPINRKADKQTLVIKKHRLAAFVRDSVDRTIEINAV